MTNAQDIAAFTRAPSIDRSLWYKGILISNLATEQDTGGAFECVEAKMRKGTEPPPHVHDREDELFYVLKGEVDVFIGTEVLHVGAGACVFMPRSKAHAFKIQSPEIHMLVFMTPGGFMNASAAMAIPAQSLTIPPDDGITYATIDLADTIKTFQKYGVRFIAPDDMARDLPCFPG